MESTPKKMKKSESASPDPFDTVHEHVHDLILQHLRGKEVLTAFEVSSRWNQLMVKSEVGMSKIKLVVDEYRSRQKMNEINMLIESKRNYQRLKVSIEYTNDMSNKMKLLSVFAPTLVDLEVSFNYLNDSVIKFEPFDLSFPKVKSMYLFIKYTPDFGAKILNAAVKLEKFKLGNCELNKTLIDSMMKLNHLTELSVDCRDFFRHEFQSASFQLKSLSLGRFLYIPNSGKAQQNYHAFLLKMSNTLQNLDFTFFYPEDLNLVFTHMQVLNSLSLVKFKGDPRLLELKPNQNITKLKIIFLYPVDSKTVVKALMNLKVLDMHFVANEELKWIAENAKKLETVLSGWSTNIFKCSFGVL